MMKLTTFMQHIASALILFLVVTSALADQLSYQLHVDGLACPFCAYGIEKKLGVIEGVQRVETNIKSGMVIVIMQDGVVLNEVMAKKAVKDAGFSLRKLKLFKSVQERSVP